ncbi:hypothetical protein Poli38472_011483 [Pythium oligandrum]|uniref:Peptidase S1 domain-containing protein n=1 Tax=Pythium oligandrum TaxID=41045 RepID=A0A8K1FNF6_PYTOL|nr:hypothetical protein Poli38472_011483 [Pythium oligandrum]|eukprot:TMW64603.1 hypothetical protein Poli38472_011483 [Pythium oligandrum]
MASAEQLVVLLLVIMAGVVQAIPSPIVILGSSTEPDVCVGVQIAPRHVIIQSSCVDRSDKLSAIRILDILDVSTTAFQSASFGIDVVDTIAIGLTAVASRNQDQERLHILTLDFPLPSSDFHPVLLPLRTPYPASQTVDSDATLVHVDPKTMQVSMIHSAIYVDESRCSGSVCALPMDVDARKPIRDSSGWSFLLQQDVIHGKYQLLGLGSDVAANPDGIWGFSWLPQLLTSAVLKNNGITGVHTVTTGHKELSGEKVTVSDSSNEFVAGLRETEFSRTNCSGALVASRYVLTAASCFKRGDFKWVVMSGLDWVPKGSERLRIKKRNPHPRYVPGTNWFDFMLLELESPAAAKPVDFLDTNVTFTEGTVFTHGESFSTFDEYLKTHALRSARIKIYTIPECVSRVKFEMDDPLMCAGGEAKGALCEGDNGGPVVLQSSKKTQHVYAVVSAGGNCGKESYYGVISVVFSVADWLHAYLDRNP